MTHAQKAFLAGFVLGVIAGLWAAVVQSWGAFDGFRCTEFSPVTGECVVFTNQEERRRYD